MLFVLDQVFFVLHSALIVFNSIGWAWSRTRVWQLVTMTATAFSWFVLGAWRGWGYCLCTDWHFRIRRRLGHDDDVDSYVQLLASHWFGIDLPLRTANVLAGTVFVAILLAMAVTWSRVWWQRTARDGGNARD